MSTQGKTVRLVQIDHDGGEHYVRCIMQDDDVEHEAVFVLRSEAEARAKAICKRYGCEWESNY